MEWLNYHHLFYFWNVAKEGTVSSAAEKLHVARTTVTSQVRELEKAAGAKLFRKSGRYLELTEFGQHGSRLQSPVGRVWVVVFGGSRVGAKAPPQISLVAERSASLFAYRSYCGPAFSESLVG